MRSRVVAPLRVYIVISSDLNNDGCYLPDGGIVLTSTACHQAVPCNSSHVSVLYRVDSDGRNMRQLAFDQDHSYHPVMMPSGRILYLRWEYSELPHAFSRILFTMNPDGSGQMEYYGSNSVWPNAIFNARPIPHRPTQFVGIVCGHHGGYREGELTLFDVARGRHETAGVIQRIPGRGKKVEPVYEDHLTTDSWPKFAHPYPLSDKYFPAAGKLGDMAVQIGKKGNYLCPIANPTKYDDWIPRNDQYNDRGLVAVDVGSYAPNAWGLYDMHGNVAEWTWTTYAPDPYDSHDGRDERSDQGRKVVRGGSWRDRPKRSRSAFRLSYPSWQGVYNVGFRVVVQVNE